MTKREKVVVSAFTGVLMCDFDDLHKYVEEILERPVWTHEMGLESVQEQIREKSFAEFYAICEREDE